MNSHLNAKNYDSDSKLRLLMYTSMPASDSAWNAGFYAALNNVSIEENPFQLSDCEYKCWENGWWSGFYEEETVAQEFLEELEKYTCLRSHSRYVDISSPDKFQSTNKEASDNTPSQRTPLSSTFYNINIKKLLIFTSIVLASIASLTLVFAE